MNKNNIKTIIELIIVFIAVSCICIGDFKNLNLTNIIGIVLLIIGIVMVKNDNNNPNNNNSNVVANC